MLREYGARAEHAEKREGLEDRWVRGGGGAKWDQSKGVSKTSTPVSCYSTKQVGPTADNSSDEGCCFIVLHDRDPDWKVDLLPWPAITVLCTWGWQLWWWRSCRWGCPSAMNKKQAVIVWHSFCVTLLLINWRCWWSNLILVYMLSFLPFHSSFSHCSPPFPLCHVYHNSLVLHC